MIRLVNIYKSYGERAVLRDVSLSVDEGEFVLLTGPSGAGKTTILRLLYAAEQPDSGDVLVAGKRVSMLCKSAIPYLRRALGFVFQDGKLLEGHTAYENIALALEVRGLGRREIRRRSIQALTNVGLAERATIPVERLSGGEQQRVALARAVVGEPSVILADEPTGNLDEAQARVVLELLVRAAERGTAVLLATHDPLAARVVRASRVVRLEGGKAIGLAPEQPRQVQWELA